MSSRGPVTRGANGWLPLTMAFCRAVSPLPLVPTTLSFTPAPLPGVFVFAYMLTSFLCWFSFGKCQVRFGSRGFWRIGWCVSDGSEADAEAPGARTVSRTAWPPVGAAGQDCNGGVHVCVSTCVGFGNPRAHCGVRLALRDLSIKSWISGGKLKSK